MWFAPNDNIGRGAAHDIVLNEDFPHLFDDDAAWSARTDVFEISAMVANGAATEENFAASSPSSTSATSNSPLGCMRP